MTGDTVESSPPQSGLVPTIQNIVCTANLNCKLDLLSIARRARNVEYRPQKFSAVTMRIKETKTTALIFDSGKIVCTGAKSEDQARLAVRKYARTVQKLGFPVRLTNFSIQNIVGSCDVKFPIRLEMLCARQADFSTYEPEYFPGLTYRMRDPKTVLSVFVSGKVVIKGAKVREELYRALEKIYPALVECRRKTKP